MTETKVAIIGSGNIGTDPTIKIMRLPEVLEMGAFASGCGERQYGDLAAGGRRSRSSPR